MLKNDIIQRSLIYQFTDLPIYLKKNSNVPYCYHCKFRFLYFKLKNSALSAVFKIV